MTYKQAKLYLKTKRYILYNIRWQLSTPIYAIVLYILGNHFDYVTNTILANLIGANIFYWIDKFIFLKHRHHSE